MGESLSTLSPLELKDKEEFEQFILSFLLYLEELGKPIVNFGIDGKSFDVYVDNLNGFDMTSFERILKEPITFTTLITFDKRGLIYLLKEIIKYCIRKASILKFAYYDIAGGQENGDLRTRINALNDYYDDDMSSSMNDAIRELYIEQQAQKVKYMLVQTLNGEE